MPNKLTSALEKPRIRDVTRWLLRFPRAVPLAIFMIIGLITFLSVVSIEASESRRKNLLMSEVSQTLANELVMRSNATEAYLRSGSALFSSNSNMQISIFENFAGQLTLDTNAQGSEGIGWAEVVGEEVLSAFYDKMNPERVLAYEVARKSGDLPTALAPIMVFRPDSLEARSVLGFDLYSNPVINQAIDDAITRQLPTATGKLQLGEAGEALGAGFLLLMPVFEGYAGESKLMGLIFSPFDAQHFLSLVMDRSAHPQMGARLYDGFVDEVNLLAHHSPSFSSGVTTFQEVMIGNRPFVVEIESAYGGGLSPLSMATLLFGLGTASLLILLLRLLSRQAAEDEAALAFFEQQNSIRNSLTRELNHRVKNTLASIISIISLTRRRTDDLDEFANGLEGRVRALSATHDLLTLSEWGTTPVRAVVEAELAPYSGGETDVRLNGPDIELAPNDALSLGLAIHELATNASKYGALSRPGAEITINWDCENQELVRLDWIERGGPEVPKSPKAGFGTDLIQKIVAHELRHPVNMRFDPEGVSCTLFIPVRVSAEFWIRERLANLSD